MAWGKDESPPDAEIQDIADYFHLGGVRSIKWADGYSNKNYFVTTERGEFLFRFLLNPRADIDKEIVYLEHLQRHSFPTMQYLASPTGSYYWKRQDLRAVVKRKLPGQPAVQSEATCRVIGEHLAWLHILPTTGLPPTSCNLGRSYVENALEIAQRSFDKDTVRPLLTANERLSHFQPERLPQSIIHGDATRNNCLFEGNALIALLDWEEVGIGASLVDMAVSILSYCYHHRGPFKDRLEISWYNSFLTGYSSVRRLSAAEERQLDSVLLYAALVESLWALLQFGLYYPDSASLRGWCHQLLLTPATEIGT